MCTNDDGYILLMIVKVYCMMLVVVACTSTWCLA